MTLLLPLLFAQTTNAASLTTEKVYFNWEPENSNSYEWAERLVAPTPNFSLDYPLYSIYPVKYARFLRVLYAQIQSQGNHATIHFETNVVASRADGPGTPLPLNAVPYFMNNDYLDEYMNVDYCTVDGTVVNIENQSLSYAQTQWLRLDAFPSVTLTIYGDLVLSGVPASGTHQLLCSWGATNQVFYNNTFYSFHTGLYVEQNPASILFTNNLSDALLAQTTAQNEVMIQNQERTNELLEQQAAQDSQDRQDMQNASNNASSSAQSSAASATQASSSLLTIIGNFINIVLNPPQTDCTIDADMGNLDLGTIDLCTLSPPPALSVIATVLLIAVLLPFVISLINTFLNLLKGATQ